ncbi:hypothetical protein [Streptomyces sp. TLI_146]|uniref:hypothetical protein n=1 Tax=Streptomyces sp. TLI_146 TaxID=1938858 RepID=UPI000CBA6AF3|nr:hypothetical protein [Streptomyces sp. TLI_146]PKV88193.1 hypothetical protein BX283_5804 [Streptomyces sp. TLI_146]
MPLASSKTRYERNGLTVPWITTWSPEKMTIPPVTLRRDARGSHLGYEQETLYDRDTNGVLWVRQGLARGKGDPDFPAVHALRQRRAMLDMLCQVCGGSTLEEHFERQLYIARSLDGLNIQESERTSAPPVCTSCAPEAVVSCPRLKGRYVAAWVTHSIPWGVMGIVHNQWTLERTSQGAEEVAYTDPRIRWTVAVRTVNCLYGCTPVQVGNLHLAL